MFHVQSGKHYEATEQQTIRGKITIPYTLVDGATALLTKDRVAFNWKRPDGSYSKYAEDDKERAECVDELEQVRRVMADYL